MLTTDAWLFELTNRVSASSGLTEPDRQARIEHLRLAFASLVDFDVHMAQQSQAKRYAEIWHTHERPDWIDPPETLWRMVNTVVDNLKYIEDIAISQLLGPIDGLADLADDMHNMPVDEAIDAVRGYSAAYVQSLYDTYNDQTQRQDLSDVRINPDDTHRPIQMPTTRPRPYEQLKVDVNTRLDEILSHVPETSPKPQPKPRHELEPEPRLQVEPEPGIVLDDDDGLTLDDVLMDDPNEYAVYDDPYMDYIDGIQQNLDQYGIPIPSDDETYDDDDTYVPDEREDPTLDPHYADAHLPYERMDELMDDVENDDDDD